MKTPWQYKPAGPLALTMLLTLCNGPPALAEPTQALITENTGLLGGSRLDLSLRNLYRSGNASEWDPDLLPHHYSTWVQGLSLDYRSGYSQDRLGFGMSYESVINLRTRTENGYTDNMLPRDLGSFSKLGQAYLRYQQPGLSAQVGWQHMYNVGVIHARDSRAAQKSYQGLRLDGEAGKWSGLLAVVDRTSDRHEPEKRRFYSRDGRHQLNHIVSGQVKWESAKNNSLLYFAGEADRYLFRQGLETSWQAQPSGLRLEAFFYHNRGLSWWERQDFSRDAYHFGFKASRELGPFTLSGGGSHTWAKPQNPSDLGFFYFNLARNAVGRFASPAYNGIFDYLHDRETMLFAALGYRPQTSTHIGMAAYHGTGMRYQQVPLRHWDVLGFIEHKPPQLKNLRLLLMVDYGQSWKRTRNGQADVASGQQINKPKIGSGFQIDYLLPLL